MQVRFWGTRGSIAKAGESTVRYGGNTSCVELRSRAGTLIVLDCGTGAHGLGQALMAERPGPLKGHILITHTHWDHIQGIPFFAPLFAKGGEWDVYAPRGVGSSIREALAGQMQYAYFPVALEDLGATIRFHDLVEGDFEVGDVRVRARYLNHPAVALGYRLESGGVSLAYVTDHEPYSRQLVGGARELHGEDGRHAEFVAGVDLLIHDAQYTADEYPSRIGWGHSTFEYVVDLARLVGVRRLALFHHDPTRDDAALDRIVAAARERVAGSALEVVAAAEGQLLQLEPTVTAPASARSASAFAARDTSAALLDHSVLVAVADPRASSILHGAVQADGLQLLTARDTDEVLELARRERPSLLLLDHDLSGRSAFGLCRALRAGDAPWARDVSIVLVTDTEDPELVRAGAEAGVSDWLFTPFSSAYARTRIRCWVLRTACRWQRAPLPPGEAERLRVLHDLGILDTDPEERLDRLTRLAAAALDVPIALISLVDTDRQWFKSAHGLDARQTPRDRAFCAHAILGDDALVVADANADPRFADNPLVTAEPRVRFYAGFPLRLDGHAIGTLCVIDHRPRHLSEVQLQLLRDLAEVVRGELTLNPAAARRR